MEVFYVVITVPTVMLDNSFFKKNLDTVLFSASHSVKIFFRMFCVLVLVFPLFHQCRSKFLYVEGLFTPFTQEIRASKLHFKKNIIFFLFLSKKTQSFKALFSM